MTLPVGYMRVVVLISQWLMMPD